jgi:hypothetical protein
LHIFPVVGGEGIIQWDSTTDITKRSVSKRAILPTIQDRQFQAVAGFVDSCQTELSNLNPQFLFDNLPCVNLYLQDNIYQGTCNYVTSQENACRTNVKSFVDNVFGTDSTAKDIATFFALKKMGGEEGIANAISGLARYALAGLAEAGVTGVALEALTVLSVLSAELIAAAFVFATTLRVIFVDTIGAQNTAIVSCMAYMAAVGDPNAFHDVTVTDLGQTFTVASINAYPVALVNSPTNFIITSMNSPTCNTAGNHLHNGGFEDDGNAFIPDGASTIYYALPALPTDPEAISEFDGWELTTTTLPPSGISTSDCFKGAQCL